MSIRLKPVFIDESIYIVDWKRIAVCREMSRALFYILFNIDKREREAQLKNISLVIKLAIA